MTTFIKKKLKDREGNYLVTPSSADIVYCSDGETVATKLRKVENDEFSPTITQMSSVSKVGVGEDIDISDNTQEGYLKSAILTGQTLVNLIKDGYMASSTPNPQNAIASIMPLDGSKEYTLMLNKNLVQVNIRFWYTDGSYGEDYAFSNRAESGYIKNKLRIDRANATGKTLENIQIYSVDANGEITNMMLLEGDYTNVDIPYFTGMQSVKMPVLTTTGKNLYNKSPFNGHIDSSSGKFVRGSTTRKISDYIEVEPNKKYKVSGCTMTTMWGYDEDKNPISAINFYDDITTTSDMHFIAFTINSEVEHSNIQLEEGTVATSYEPYKSNILTTSEDVVLRGIGEVKDELNVSPGELTQRIKEIVFDGSDDEAWSFGEMKGDNYKFGLSLKTDVYGSGDRTPILSDKFAAGNLQTELTQEQVMIYNHTNYMELRLTISPNKLTSNTGQALKDYLKANPFTIQYALGTPAVKTVDLEPLGTNPTTQPYVWKDGHIQLSSEEGSLLPTLDYSVTTSRGGQILENTKHIAKQDKRIYDLEMLMINSSVEDAYQRLLLQNDVQVMSRMDETHLNPMRYYMLTRLIEEKMYEETDMLNKLDTFFLYGDISSDQYFELMDKIFGMEEIVEEDFTEEK